MELTAEQPLIGDAEHVAATAAAFASVASDLDTPHPLTDQQRAFFREYGFIKLKHVLSPKTLNFYARVIADQVRRLNTQHLPVEQRDLYGRAFLQVMNIWTKNAVVRDLVFSRKLARLAAELMGVDGVRLYHDQALFKEPGGGITPWHADQFYWPVDTDNTVTVWIPLQDTPLEMGPLAFAPGSHQLNTGRDVSISQESEELIGRTLHDLKMKIVEEPFELGEVSYHLGWNWHRAGANQTQRVRRAMTVIYLDEKARLLPARHRNHVTDRDAWMPGLQAGELVNTLLNPVLWSATTKDCSCSKGGPCSKGR